jgi:dihydroorotase
MGANLLLRGGRVVDLAQDLDAVADVAIVDGRISAVGPGLAAPPDARVIDVAGQIVSPGFLDIHVHSYGGLAFADPDTIGVNLGSTVLIDGGGPGAWSWDEFEALLLGRTRTDLYVWLMLRAAGIYGTDPSERIGRTLIDIPINRMLDILDRRPGVIRGIKVTMYATNGMGPARIGKGVGNVLGLPIYVHIGEIFDKPDVTYTAEVLDLLEPRDLVTHCYHNNPGRLLDDDGRVLPQAWAARERGVLFDTGHGAFNFSFDVAERALAQGFVPDTISSDLQQANVLGPVYSLMHCMSGLMAIGMSLHDVLRRVTVDAAAAADLSDRHGSLQPGRAADVTVCGLEAGEYEFEDSSGGRRPGRELLVPLLTVKGGELIQPDRGPAEDFNNWSLEGAIAYDEVPDAAAALSPRQREFVGRLASTFADLEPWKGVAVHESFRRTQEAMGLPLRDALVAALDSFLTTRFSPPVGFFLASLERDLVLSRFRAVAASPAVSVPA